MTDNRMGWVRSISALASAAIQPIDVLEVEFASEARIMGECTLADGALLMRPITFTPDDRGFFKYVLRQLLPQRDDPPPESASPEEVEQPYQGDPKGYLFPGGMVGELLALISLRLQARVFLTSTTNRRIEGGGVPSWKQEYRGPTQRVDPRADGFVFDESGRSFADVIEFLEKVRRLPEKHHLEIAVAAGQYARALRFIGNDEEQVYIYLVSAIERLCQKQRIEHDPLQGLKIDQMVRTDTLEPDQVDLLKDLIGYRKSTLRFVSFLVEHGRGLLQPEEADSANVSLKTLPAIAKAIYDARSKYLHEGVPMYISPRILSSEVHMDGSVGMTNDNRWYDEKQKLPRVEFFHRLVRHCILHRLEELSPPTSP